VECSRDEIGEAKEVESILKAEIGECRLRESELKENLGKRQRETSDLQSQVEDLIAQLAFRDVQLNEVSRASIPPSLGIEIRTSHFRRRQH